MLARCVSSNVLLDNLSILSIAQNSCCHREVLRAAATLQEITRGLTSVAATSVCCPFPAYHRLRINSFPSHSLRNDLHCLALPPSNSNNNNNNKKTGAHLCSKQPRLCPKIHPPPPRSPSRFTHLLPFKYPSSSFEISSSPNHTHPPFPQLI
ncbi:hypothetical protein BC939DRAFT_266643 [Gamsiella multidivaricata]|uniref:uncharacterized protein n=1 Tax=Gamsiella multidivaricata TaxID=101098 RepID=UPI002220D23E|nr:uncharacterized protein BC939DRAFT_266643 [Gamsiella multidivaricata]KAI7819335.1 hypothetical protein BC939DRAFT_266643 [Gamsiella multidivaricata]